MYEVMNVVFVMLQYYICKIFNYFLFGVKMMFFFSLWIMDGMILYFLGLKQLFLDILYVIFFNMFMRLVDLYCVCYVIIDLENSFNI